MKKNILSLMLLVAATTATAQNAGGTDKHVSGTITDAATGKPLVGVSVQAYGNKRFAAMTDANGHYEITVPEYVNSLTIAVDGYGMQQTSLTTDGTVDAKLYSNKFSPVYKAVTTATNSSVAANFDNTSEISIDPLIEQRLGADVRSVSRGGNPGMGSMMLIDGINSLNAGSQPLIVIDGVIQDMQYDRSVLHDGCFNNMLANININDIERVTVMKNGTALYGAKAANGVILIETKRNKSMATKIDVDINCRFDMRPKLPEIMGANDYRLYASELVSSQTDNVAGLKFMNPDPQYYYYPMYHNQTDWREEVYRKSSLGGTSSQNYGINVQGGDDVANYNLSVGYAMANSVLRNNDYTRFNMRLNSDISISRKLSVRFDASYSDVDRDLRDDGAPDVTGSIPQLATSPAFLGLVKSPFLSPYAIDLSGNKSHYLSEADDYLSGVFDNNDWSLPNPNSILENAEGKNYNQLGNRMIVFSITPKFDFNRHLSLSEHFTFSLVNTNETYYLPVNGVPSHRVEGLGEFTYVNNTARSLAARQNQIQSDTRLSWNWQKKAHKVNAIGGFRLLSQNYNMTAQYGYNTGNDKTPSISFAGTYRSTAGADDKSRDLTWYALGDYSFADRYYLSAGVSAQASSRFGDDADGLKAFGTVWGLFPSVNAGWVLTNEKFFNVKGIDYLRLNAGYDITGNDNIDYTARRTYFVANKMLGSSVDGLSLGNIGNTSLKWETTRRLTAGLEGNFFSNRLNLRVDYFKSWTSDLLSLSPLAWTSGLAENWANNGKMENHGISASLNVKLLALKDFQWEAGASVGHYKNTVTALPNNQAYETNAYGATVLTQVGSSAGVFYGYQTARRSVAPTALTEQEAANLSPIDVMGMYTSRGKNLVKVFANSEEADAANLHVKDSQNNLHKFQAGDVEFVDFNGDGIIDANDRTVIGNPNPDIYGNIYTKLAWKNWTLSAVFSYCLGNDVFNYQRMLLEGGSRFFNQSTALNGRWKGEDQITEIPQVSYGDPMGNSRFSDRWIEDGSYLRLSDLTLSYHIPMNWVFLQGLTFWGSATNLFTLTHYLGSDPDCSMGSNPLVQGIDRGLLSRGRALSVGVKVNL